MQPLLSIVVLVYNTAEYLHECFDSLLTQEYRNIEVIAIDDCSTDNSYEICLDYQQRYGNFRCLTKPNEGGAVSANLGVSMARGEYVAMVDSDDMVPSKGYALLMEQAIEHKADIVIGRAARYKGKILPGPLLFEPFVWAQHRVVNDIRDYPDLINDCFYWNKVFRTGFMRENNLGMVPGLLYADRPLAHRAYYYSKKTVVIPDLVYLWRIRDSKSGKSISQSKSEGANFVDRVRSMRIEWQDFEGVPEAHWYRCRVAAANLQRVLHVMPGIVSSPSLRAAYVAETQSLLELYGDLDYRALGARRCVLLHLLARGEIEGICYLLGRPMHDRLVKIDDAVYWNQPFLNNAELDIDPEIARIAFPTIGFFKLVGIELLGSRLTIQLELHDLIWNDSSIGFELNALYCEGTLMFRALGRVAPNRYAYELDLAQANPPADELGRTYGLAMRYQWQDISGVYRIGVPLVSDPLLRSLPQISAGYQVVCSHDAGGCAVIMPAPSQDEPNNRSVPARTVQPNGALSMAE